MRTTQKFKLHSPTAGAVSSRSIVTMPEKASVLCAHWQTDPQGRNSLSLWALVTIPHPAAEQPTEDRVFAVFEDGDEIPFHPTREYVYVDTVFASNGGRAQYVLHIFELVSPVSEGVAHD